MLQILIIKKQLNIMKIVTIIIHTQPVLLSLFNGSNDYEI